MKFLISLFVVIGLYAQVIDKIDIIVNGIPITSYDIKKTEQKLQINKNQAVSYLINQAILQSAIKERGIYVDDFDIDNAMQKIAQKNGMSLFDFKNYLLQKGELEQFKEKLKVDLEKQKLIETLNTRVTKEDVENYYNLHKNEFMLPSKIETTKYSSSDKNALIEVLQNPLSQNMNVSIEDITFDANKTNPRLMQFLANVKEGEFSPIITLEGKFTSFYIQKKSKPISMPKQMVEAEIFQKLSMQKRKEALDDFIAKLRAKADIKFLN